MGKVQQAAFRAPQEQMQGGATQADAAQCKHCGDPSKRSLDIVEEHAPIMLCIIGVRSRRPCAAGTLWAHRGCGQSLRCSSSTMSRIDSSSRLELASQALCARPIVLLPRAARDGFLSKARFDHGFGFRCYPFRYFTTFSPATRPEMMANAEAIPEVSRML